MTSRARLGVLGAAFGLALVGVSAGWAQDAKTVINQRQDLMKTQGKALAAIKAFIEGKGDLAAAQAAGAELVQNDCRISRACSRNRPAWPSIPARPTQSRRSGRNGTSSRRRRRHGRMHGREALNAALQGGDKAAISDRLRRRMGKEGCGGCHTPFRQPKT